MKKFKNFTSGFLGLTILSLGLYACSGDDATNANNTTEQTIQTMTNKKGNIQRFYGRVILPTEFGNNSDANFSALIDVENEKVLEYKIDESIAIAYKIDYSKLNENFRFEMGSLLSSLNEKPKDDGAKFTEHAGCIQACKNKYIIDGEKQKGLGGCKASCWVDTAVRVLEAIIPNL